MTSGGSGWVVGLIGILLDTQKFVISISDDIGATEYNANKNNKIKNSNLASQLYQTYDKLINS